MDSTWTQRILCWGPTRGLGESMRGMAEWYTENQNRPYGVGAVRAFG
jgi:hypothetical protein